jgi:hypothetical protein
MTEDCQRGAPRTRGAATADTLMLLRAGHACVPYSSLESVIEQGKEGYYLALRQTQETIRTSARTARPDTNDLQ